MSSESFNTFAYGSNMLTKRVQIRCPTARPIGVAELPGYALRWHKKSKDGSGKCDIVKTDQQGASVFGVLFEIGIGEKTLLDKAEGLGSGYDEMQVRVLLGAVHLTVNAYVATATKSALKPYTWYRALVVAGAKEHRLPADYIARLEAEAANQDPDQKRHDDNMALIGDMRA